MMVAPQGFAGGGQSLQNLLAGLVEAEIGDDLYITGLASESRSVEPGMLFLACFGQRSRGHDHVHEALRRGAIAVAYELPITGSINVPPHIPSVGVDKLSQKVGLIADRFYEHPSHDLFTVGVTGTNGKTSTSHFLAHALSDEGARTSCGLIGTLGAGFYGNLGAGLHTTPNPLTLHALLAEFRDAGAKDVVMEVSSHGVQQGRINGVEFDAAIFTNLSRDHLDYHGDMVSYASVKKRLFMLPELRFAAINLDDPFGLTVLDAVSESVEVVGYSLLGENARATKAKASAEARYSAVRGTVLRSDMTGVAIRLDSRWGSGVLRSSLFGDFNVSNLLAALSVLLLKGVAFDEAVSRLATVKPVPGRMERFIGGDLQPMVVVDYAHTPDALSKVLVSLRNHCSGKLWCVFGCGGDRDPGKRPEMGAIAERCADHVVITDDNPRFEDPQKIVADITKGMSDRRAVQVVRDRRDAIAYAITNAKHNDVVLVAGKGHEDYQEARGVRRQFSDRLHVCDLLGEAMKP